MRASRAFAIDLRAFSQSSGVGSIASLFFFAIVVFEEVDDHIELSVHSHHESTQGPNVGEHRQELLWRLASLPPHGTMLSGGERISKRAARD